MKLTKNLHPIIMRLLKNRFNLQQTREKLNLENERKDKFERINELVFEMESLYGDVDVINNKLSAIDNHIDESEWQIESNSNEEITFNEIKQKLIIEKKLNYGSI
jgi:hypothetical protein